VADASCVPGGFWARFFLERSGQHPRGNPRWKLVVGRRLACERVALCKQECVALLAKVRKRRNGVAAFNRSQAFRYGFHVFARRAWEPCCGTRGCGSGRVAWCVGLPGLLQTERSSLQGSNVRGLFQQCRPYRERWWVSLEPWGGLECEHLHVGEELRV
jgi:hypothetical protein